MKKKSKAEKVGINLATAIWGMVQLFYQMNTSKNFWKGFFNTFEKLGALEIENQRRS